MAKKSQMEVMGLAVLIVLILVGIIFAMRFIAFKEPTSVKQAYADSQFASDLLTSIMQSSAPEECVIGLSMADLFSQCSLANRKECMGKDYCTYAVDKTKDVLDELVKEKRGKGYEFKVSTALVNGDEKIEPVSYNCDGNKERGGTGVYQVIGKDKDSTRLFMTLSICD